MPVTCMHTYMRTAHCRRWAAWARSPISRQLLGLLTAAVEAAERASESWLLPGRGGAAAAAAAAAEPRLDSMEVAIVAAVELLSCVSKLPVGEEWPALCQWLLAGGGMHTLSSVALYRGALKDRLVWIAICPAAIAVDMYSRQRVSGDNPIWRDPALADGMKHHFSLLLRVCAEGGGLALEDVIVRSFRPMAIATEVVPNLAQQLHPDLLRLWPHLFSSLQLTDGWEPLEAVVPNLLRLIEALPSAVKCSHWRQHCSIAVDALSLAVNALEKSEQPELAGTSRKGERLSGAAVLMGRAVGMIDSLSKLPNWVHLPFTELHPCHTSLGG